ncbi:hypothetical protein TELCIR_15681 [Teladorsagia circumcincta]|uniref:Uncharacterized protein n=1 Tax=Teladorsagia circumcincta TaxID=45464 RepID=A0A2G9TXT5_TELCI|nr:hypothetical protein TELCIR_15681 [Teladorsagia circumcincta]
MHGCPKRNGSQFVATATADIEQPCAKPLAANGETIGQREWPCLAVLESDVTMESMRVKAVDGSANLCLHDNKGCMAAKNSIKSVNNNPLTHVWYQSTPSKMEGLIELDGAVQDFIIGPNVCNENCLRTKLAVAAVVTIVVGWVAYAAYEAKKRRDQRYRRDF